MSLRDEAARLSKRSGPQTSTIFRIIDSLDGDEREDVIALIWDDVNTSSRAVGDVLTRHFGDRFGRVTDQQVRVHRTKDRPA